ncbi:MAG: CDP-glycerol glycerophosphotransferase family protein [Lachnospiraceae bacterium]|nr:CDP-glycerol glycerophosphotransferase family protein [Lachnospiraceae bacterium]
MDSDDYILSDTLRVMAEAVRTGLYDIITGPIDETMFKYATYVGGNGHKNNAEASGARPECRTSGCLSRKSPGRGKPEGGHKPGNGGRPEHIRKSDRFLAAENMRGFNLTILNSLIRRDYIMKAHTDGSMLVFDAENELYCDMAYTAALYGNTDNICFLENMKYIKRIHNDSIQFPAVDQLKVKERNTIFLKNLDGAVSASGRDDLIAGVVGKIKKERAAARRKRRQKRIRNFFARPTYLFRMIEKYLFRQLPMKRDWIVFESFLGKNYSDSCKYIYQYLNREYGSKYRYIWVINDKKTDIPGDVTKVKYLGLRWFYYTSRAGYYVNNMRQPVWLDRRDGSVLLETWHGTPLKKLVFDMDDIHAATPQYKMDVYAQSRKWTYLISDNPFSTKVFESCFLFSKDRIIETGYPRNDILYAPDREEQAAGIKEKLFIPKDKKVILYAPTWRDDEYYGPGRYQFALKLDLKKMKDAFGDSYVILIRTHYFIADAVDTAGLDGFAVNVSRYDDIAELYLISDICITDYSSVFFDYANLKRPILFYVYDFEKYRDKLRGFYIDMETELPGPLLYTEDEVFEALRNIDAIKNEFKALYDEFYDRFCCIDDGHAAERVSDIVFAERN